MSKTSITKLPSRKTISIIVDGETEKWYFQLLKEYEKLKSFDIKPDLPKKRKLKEVYDQVVTDASNYYKVLWIIDLDVVIKESQKRKKGSKPISVVLSEYIEKLKKKKNVEVLINTPCFEFWLLLHFRKTGKYFQDYDEVCNEFRNTILKGYEKTEKYYKSANNIYKKIRPYRDTAITNAECLGDFDPLIPQQAKAEIYKFFKIPRILEKNLD